MKKIKIIALVIISSISLFSLFGCVDQRGDALGFNEQQNEKYYNDDYDDEPGMLTNSGGVVSGIESQEGTNDFATFRE